MNRYLKFRDIGVPGPHSVPLKIAKETPDKFLFEVDIDYICHIFSLYKRNIDSIVHQDDVTEITVSKDIMKKIYGDIYSICNCKV